MRKPMFLLRYRQRVFAPSLLMSFFTLIFFVLFVVLGQWQLTRAEYKRAISDRFQAKLAQDYQKINLDFIVNKENRYQKIKLTGSYDNDFVMLLDNKIHGGQAGYHVLVPFVIDQYKAVLVNRGWVAAGDSRNVLPKILSSPTSGEVRGILTLPNNAGYRLGGVTMTGKWPQLIPYIELDKIELGLPYKLVPYVIWLSAEIDDYYIRDWKPVWSSPEKSEAYAVQWFSFSIIVLVLYVSLNIKKYKEEKVND